MIEFCFTQLEYYLKQIKNSQNQYVFQASKRLVREKPDFDFVIANVIENNPYCLIVISDYKETLFNSFFDTYPEYYITNVIHSGTGSAEYEITGNHEGNNSYVLTIITGGTIGGGPPYPEYNLAINGKPGATQIIPADGKIPIGDGTTFEFEIGGEVVQNDIYSWSTVARRVNINKEKEIEFKLRVTIWSRTKKELFATDDGYFAQLSNLINEPFVTDGIQFIRQSPGPSRWLNGPFEQGNNLICGAIEISYQGAMYRTTYDALACRLVLSL